MLVRGGMIGLAIGDAMGAPLEGLPAPHSAIILMSSGGPRNHPKGYITDDTSQALAIAKSLISCRGFIPDDIVHRLIECYVEMPSLYGPTSRKAFEYILEGLNPYYAAFLVHIIKKGSRSNGSVMRGAPLGVFYSHPSIVREISILCSQLTHYDLLAAECSSFINIMVGSMCRGSTRHEAFTIATRFCRNDEVQQMLGSYWRFKPVSDIDALLTTHSALSVFLTAQSFEEAIIRAVNYGGDADTVGAVCGALSGAYWGIGNVPNSWLKDLNNHEDILRIAHQLWTVSENQ